MPLRRVFVGSIVAASVALALTTATVDGAGNQTIKEKSLLTGSKIPVPVRAVLERACQDCHSENTVWPWYSHIHREARLSSHELELIRAWALAEQKTAKKQ
jgi:hypothetical protein